MYIYVTGVAVYLSPSLHGDYTSPRTKETCTALEKEKRVTLPAAHQDTPVRPSAEARQGRARVVASGERCWGRRRCDPTVSRALLFLGRGAFLAEESLFERTEILEELLVQKPINDNLMRLSRHSAYRASPQKKRL